MTNDLAIDTGLPANTSAERTLLGCVLLDNGSFYEIAGALEADDFSLDSHRRIFLRMADLMEAQRPVDIVTLSYELDRHKEVATIGGVPYLASLTEGLPRRLSPSEYLRIVKDKAFARRLMLISSSAIARAADGTESAETIAAEAIEQMQGAQKSVVNRGCEVKDAMPEAVTRFLAEANSQDGGILGAHLLTPDIDRVTAGLMAEELCLLAGRPGSGKTEGGLQIALRNARAGMRVYFQSLEMRRESLLRRLWRIMARVPVSAMRDPRCLNLAQREAIKNAQEELLDLPIFIDDTHELTISEFRSRAVLAAKRWRADLLVVDYAQLLLVPRSRSIIEAAPRQAEALRHIARDYCRTLALAQIRRAPPNDLNRYPDIEDILGSSAFEQAAQVILLLHRTRENKTFTGEDYCFLGKMRELQDIKPFGIRAEKWGEFADRYESGQQTHWNDRD